MALRNLIRRLTGRAGLFGSGLIDGGGRTAGRRLGPHYKRSRSRFAKAGLSLIFWKKPTLAPERTHGLPIHASPRARRGRPRLVLLSPLAFLPQLATASPAPAPAPAAPAGLLKPPAPPPYPPAAAPLHAAHAAVASDHPLASAAGLAALKAGGNAVDAACATALALGVLHPDASGIGGGGFAVVWIAKEKKAYALDFRERAPAAITPELLPQGRQARARAVERGRAGRRRAGRGARPGRPGQALGQAALSACVDAGRRWLAKGVPVSVAARALAATLSEATTPVLDPAFTKMFGSAPSRPAEKPSSSAPELAATLAKLRAERARTRSTRAPIADEIVKAVTAAGGVLTRAGSGSYTSRERSPLETTYRGLRVVTMPPASSGGVALVETLGILGDALSEAGRPAAGARVVAYLHVAAEALKHAFADRARFLGDTRLRQRSTWPQLTSPAYPAELAARIKTGRRAARDAYGTLAAAARAAQGRQAPRTSACRRRGQRGGADDDREPRLRRRTCGGQDGHRAQRPDGRLLAQPGVPNAFGLIGSEQNAVAPDKRPLSSMTPTVVLDGDNVKLVVGAAGGPTIIIADGPGDDQRHRLAAGRPGGGVGAAHPRPVVAGPAVRRARRARDVRDGLEKRGHKLDACRRAAAANVLVRHRPGPRGGRRVRAAPACRRDY